MCQMTTTIWRLCEHATQTFDRCFIHKIDPSAYCPTDVENWREVDGICRICWAASNPNSIVHMRDEPESTVIDWTEALRTYERRFAQPASPSADGTSGTAADRVQNSTAVRDLNSGPTTLSPAAAQGNIIGAGENTNPRSRLVPAPAIVATTPEQSAGGPVAPDGRAPTSGPAA